MTTTPLNTSTPVIQVDDRCLQSGTDNESAQADTAAAFNSDPVPSLFLQKRIALLTSYLLPDRAALMRAFASYTTHTRIFLSSRLENHGDDIFRWADLDVAMLATYRRVHRFQHANGYKDQSEIHVPLNIITQLWRYRPDVVITGEFGVRTLWAIVYKILRPKTKLVLWATLSQRTETSRGSVRQRLRRFILKRVDAALVNATDGSEYLRQLGFAGSSFQIPYVVDPGEFEGQSIASQDGVLRLLYAGQLVERKGIYPFCVALYRSCKQHPDRKVSLRIAGAGPERERIESLDTPANMEVTFLGFLDRRQLVNEYHAASLYVFPTLGDEWGLVVNESLSAGVPVLGSCHSLAAEQLVHDGCNGWLFDPADPDELFAAINRVFSTSFEALHTMGENARASMEAWTPSVVGRRMAEAIAAIADA